MLRVDRWVLSDAHVNEKWRYSSCQIFKLISIERIYYVCVCKGLWQRINSHAAILFITKLHPTSTN